MEGKGRGTGFRAIYSKRSPSGSLARARYIHQAYRGCTVELHPTLAAHVRTCTPGTLEPSSEEEEARKHFADFRTGQQRAGSRS